MRHFSDEQFGAGLGEPHVSSGLVQPQPTVARRSRTMARKEKAEREFDRRPERPGNKSKPGCKLERKRIDNTEPRPFGGSNDVTCAGTSAPPKRKLRLAGREMPAMFAKGVRRGKAVLSSGCKSHPAPAPAGSNRSSHGGDEMAEAFG